MKPSSLQRVPGGSTPGTALCAVLALLLLALPAFADPEERRDPYAYFFIQTFGDLPEEMDLARKEGKLGMLLFFEADACGYCEYMRKNVLSKVRVQEWFREHFVNISIDIHGDVEVRDFDGITLPMKIFAEHRRVYLTPVTSFIDLDGNEIYRHMGMVKETGEFLLLGEYIEGKHYLDTEFGVFADSRGHADDDGILVTPAGESE